MYVFTIMLMMLRAMYVFSKKSKETKIETKVELRPELRLEFELSIRFVYFIFLAGTREGCYVYVFMKCFVLY